MRYNTNLRGFDTLQATIKKNVRSLPLLNNHSPALIFCLVYIYWVVKYCVQFYLSSLPVEIMARVTLMFISGFFFLLNEKRKNNEVFYCHATVFFLQSGTLLNCKVLPTHGKCCKLIEEVHDSVTVFFKRKQ